MTTPRKFPIGTKLRFYGEPCEVVGFEIDGRYAVRRVGGRLRADGTRPLRVTRVSEKTLLGKGYEVVERPGEQWTVRAGGLALEGYTRAAALQALADIEVTQHGITRVELRSNFDDVEVWIRYEGTGKFTREKSA